MEKNTTHPDWRFFASAVALHKLFLALCMGAGAYLFANDPGFATVFSAWDSYHYLLLAREGYQAENASTAFYPLLPLLIRSSAPLFFGSSVWAGLFLSNVTSVLAFSFFYRLVWETHGGKAARFSLAALLVFPTSLFFSLIYTESFFWLEFMVLFWAMRHHRVGAAALAAYFMPLTRAVGFFVVIVVAWHWFEQRRLPKLSDAKPNAWLLAVAGGVLGWLTYLGLMWSWTGSPFEGFDSQKFYAYQPSIANIFNPMKWGAAFFQWRSFHDPMTSVLDRLCFVIFIGSLYWVWKLSRTYFVWALCAGLVPALSNCFFSYIRYFVCVFPLFILMGILFQNSQRRWVFWYYLAFLLCLQAVFVVRYACHWWAG